MKEKRVSLKLISAVLTFNIHFFFFFFLTLIPLAKITTKFNKNMYAKMRAKKDEPLSNIGKKTVRITGRGSPAVLATSTTPVAFGAETTSTASPSTSIEELPTPASKRPHLSSKEKERLIPIRLPSGVTRGLLWTGLTGLSLLKTSRSSLGCPPILWQVVMFIDSSR